MDTRYVDLHCHPSLKPYSKSFKYDPIKKNDLDPNRKNSIWHYGPPNGLEKFINRLVTLTKFSQSDMTTLAKCDAKVVVVALYPFEKHFLTKKIYGWKGLTDVLVNLAASLSQKRIDFVRNHSNYFDDLISEYDFYKQLNNQVSRVGDVIYTYRVVSSNDEIEANMAVETDTKKIINIILTIEGGHAFNTGLEMNRPTANEAEVMANVTKVKSWEHRPLFITFAHHFYNELCGHAPSISIGALKDNQSWGLNTDFTDLGKDVLNKLLDNTNHDRILIDIKHMSKHSRKSFYHLLDTEYSGEEVPIVASHGAANGKRSLAQWDQTDYPEMAKWFNDIDINFYDDELVRIGRSNGLFGIQLDERRIGSKPAIKKSKIFFPNKRKQLRKKSLLVWRQVEHTAEVLNAAGLFCWGIQSIGSDFDGIVNPIKGIWTSENIKDLAEEMLNHARAYMDANRDRLADFNRISAEAIIERVLQGNAMEFIGRNY